MVPTGVAVVLTNELRAVLLGKRLKDSSRNLYGLPGGRLEPGETLADCARRELREEVGGLQPFAVGGLLTAPVQLFAAAHAPGHTDEPWVTVYFHVHLLAGAVELSNPEPDKCAGWEWHQVEVWGPQGMGLFGGRATLQAMELAAAAVGWLERNIEVGT